MRETVTINRIIQCSFIGKEVAQQISAYTLTMQQNQITSEILTKYCSAEHACKCPDCQFIIGLSGKSYTKSLESIYTCLSKE
ncbi:hypothetical protein [Pelosinus sp. IPA-1]|uniref:hypothetical protein n=1 Tax=Pelosinus sp. IPA-1 TaxID=3029569 RepID=UPI0024362A12|nr:hypothetical protein [Pelosinus sp. IPA-1]GMA97424.1 hypothetical protein PIPA1_02240 [Pelosinus sp. IPA-1]